MCSAVCTLCFVFLPVQFAFLVYLFLLGCVLFSLQMQQKVVYLEEQIRLATVEKDHVLSELLHAQEEAEQSKTAVHNLQTVLEQFQKGLWYSHCFVCCRHHFWFPSSFCDQINSPLLHTYM